jgi:carboxypeptidase D
MQRVLVSICFALAIASLIDARMYSPKLTKGFADSDTPRVAQGSAPAVSYDNSTYRVTSLPGLKPTTDLSHFAGIIPVSSGGLFFWLFESESSPETAPLAIWMNGGPGCSSLEGLFYELGPLVLGKTMTGDWDVSINPYSWHKRANMLFVDQPVGTGLSFTNGSYANSTQQVAAEFYQFLQTFYEIFPSYKTRDLYIFGESYAGIYIPTISTYILDQNDALQKSNPEKQTIIQLTGIGIGNGWIDVITQSVIYPELGRFTGILNSNQQYALDQSAAKCYQDMLKGNFQSAACQDNLLGDLSNASGNNVTGQVNVYDMRFFDPTGGAIWPYAVVYMAEYLANPNVLQQVHVDNRSVWSDCNGPVYTALAGQEGAGTLKLLPRLIETMPVLLYSGQFDIICNHLGTEQFLTTIDWPHRDEFLNANRSVWVVNSTNPAPFIGGYVQKFSNLTYLLVLNASHMVPFSVPEASLDMFTRFIRSKDYSDLPQFYAPFQSGVGPFGPNSNNNSPLPVYGWVLIIIAAFVVGCGLSAIVIVSAFRKRDNYDRLN